MGQSAAGQSAESVFQDAPTAQLAAAACRGDVVAARKAVGSGARINAAVRISAAPRNGTAAEHWTAGEADQTPLTWAMRCENLDGMEALLELGADPNQVLVARTGGVSETYQDTAVMRAAENGPPAVLKALVAAKGDATLAFGDGRNALELAFQAGHLKEAPDRAAHPNASYAEKVRRRAKDFELYYVLLDSGVDINAAHGGRTIAHEVVLHRQFGMAEELVDRGFKDTKLVERLVRYNSAADAAPDVLAERAHLLHRLEPTNAVKPG